MLVLVTWRRKEPGHHQPWNWPGFLGIIRASRDMGLIRYLTCFYISVSALPGQQLRGCLPRRRDPVRPGPQWNAHRRLQRHGRSADHQAYVEPDVWRLVWGLSPKRKWCHFNEICIISLTGSCQMPTSDRYSHWLKFRPNAEIFVLLPCFLIVYILHADFFKWV